MSKHLKLITSIVAIVFSVLNIVAFFIPTIHASIEGVKMNVSSMDIAFVSEDAAMEKAENAAKNEDVEATAKYSFLAGLKSEEGKDMEGRDALLAGAWLHFVSMLFSVAVIVFAILSLCGKTFNNFDLIYRVLACAAFALMFASMISYAVFFTTEVESMVGFGEVTKVKMSEMYKVNAGFILGVISTLIAAVATWLPCHKAQKTTK